jgi:hypothetical protein
MYRCGNLFRNFWRIAFLALFVCLCSCDDYLFGSDSKEIAHRYRLKRIGNPSQFVLLAPYDTGGLIIEEIGWPKPFILARAFGSQYWDRIDSDHAEHIRISDAERRLDQRYRSIPENAEAAWSHLLATFRAKGEGSRVLQLRKDSRFFANYICAWRSGYLNTR